MLGRGYEATIPIPIYKSLRGLEGCPCIMGYRVVPGRRYWRRGQGEKPDRKKLSPIFGFVFFGQPRNRLKKVGFRSGKTEKKVIEKNDFRFSVHNPGYITPCLKLSSSLLGRSHGTQQSRIKLYSLCVRPRTVHLCVLCAISCRPRKCLVGTNTWYQVSRGAIYWMLRTRAGRYSSDCILLYMVVYQCYIVVRIINSDVPVSHLDCLLIVIN